jgi:UDP-glucose 4-epimerase
VTWLVTGGAGYIGAHVVGALARAGEGVVVLDDLSTGRAERLDDAVPLTVGSVLDAAVLAELLHERPVTGIVHTAAKKQVGESVAHPLDYYRENVTGLQTVLEAAVAAGVRDFVFSSSAAVYGAPDVAEVTERTEPAPVSPYGQTKLVGEWLVRSVAAAHPLRYVSLRYFNVAGAARPELADLGIFNLVPMVFGRLTAGTPPVIFGADYDTPDGTCIRDYIHVGDIASAHLAAARYLRDTEGGNLVLNVGRGKGVSVREMIDTILEITGYQDLRPKVTDRRPGDPARVVARADRIRSALGWSARYDLRSMVESAWEGWCRTHPEARRRP